MLKIIELQTKLAALFGPSGDENAVARFISEYSTPYSDGVSVDIMGNLIVHKKGNGKKLMLVAHMDSVGIMVTKIEKSGYLRFCSISASKSVTKYIGSQVVFSNGIKGYIYGDHPTNINDYRANNNLFVDIGANSYEDAEKVVRVGDMAVYQPNTYTQNNKLFSNCLDDRIGCAILMSVLSKLKNCTNDIYFVFSVQEEVGFRGVKTVTQKIVPDYAIAVDVTAASDAPFNDFCSNIVLGNGAAIKIADNTILCNKEVVLWLEETASTKNVPYQREILQLGGTDAGAMQVSGSGVPVGGVSLPARYVHNSIEVADLSDVDACIALLLEAIISGTPQVVQL